METGVMTETPISHMWSRNHQSSKAVSHSTIFNLGALARKNILVVATPRNERGAQKMQKSVVERRVSGSSAHPASE